MEELLEKIRNLNNTPKQVFLSYRSTKIDFACRLFEELKNHDIETWFDKDILHENVGALYPKLIQKGIDDADIFLFLYSKDSEDSEFIINNEVLYAHNAKKTIFCFPIDTPDFNTMNPVLSECISEREWINRDSDAAYCFSIREAVEGEKLRQEKNKLTSKKVSPSLVYTDVNIYLIRITLQQALNYSTAVGNYKTLSKSDDVYREGELELIVRPLRFTIPPSEQKEQRLRELNFYSPEHKNLQIAEERSKIKKEIDSLYETIKPDNQTIYNILVSFIEKHYNLDDIYGWLLEFKPSYVSNIPREEFTVEKFISVASDMTSDRFIYELDELDKGHFNGSMTGVYEIKEIPTPDVERKRTEINLYYSDYFTFWCTVEIYHILCTIKDCFHEVGRYNIKEYSPFLCSLGLGGFIIANQKNSQKLAWVKRGKTISASSLWHFTYDETSSIYKDGCRNEEGELIISDNNIKLDATHHMYRGIKEEVGIDRQDLNPKHGIFEVGLIKCDRLEVEILSYSLLDCPTSPSLAMQFNSFRTTATDAHNEIDKFDFSPLINSTFRYTGRFMTPESEYLSRYLNDNLSRFEQQLPYNEISEQIKCGRNVKIGKGCLIEENSFIGDNCVIGEQCRIHRNVFIDNNTRIGNYVKIQNNNSIYHGVELDDGVFIGTNVSFINDRHPRAINPEDGSTRDTFKLETTHVCYGASIGAGAVVMCGVTIGKFAMVAAGAVVVTDVPERTMVAGNPARVIKENIEY